MQGSWIFCLARAADGHVLAGAEDTGCWRLEGGAGWKQFPSDGSLAGHTVYAIASDRLGRTWIGTEQGVTVTNGVEARSYGLLDGPTGPVRALAVSPIDGDVFMGTDSGITRYSLRLGTWANYTTRVLPSGQISAMAFDKSGTLYVGTQCEGIAVGKPADNYQRWRVIQGPAEAPTAATGAGLPSALINALLSCKSGSIVAATTRGIAYSRDSGVTWTYLTVTDWFTRYVGLYGVRALPTDRTGSQQLPGDDVLSLAEEGGMLWLGSRQGGYGVLDEKTLLPVGHGGDDYVTSILPVSGGVLVGHYGNGLTLSTLPISSRSHPQDTRVEAAAPGSPVPLPAPAAAPIASEL